MRVLIMSDMEGVSGIVVWNQVTGGDPMFEEGRQLYTEEINAAVRGARAAGATEVVVVDCHGAGRGWSFNSLVPEKIHPDCEWVAHHGWGRYDDRNLWFNDDLVGETDVNAALNGHYGVPVALVTGDAAVCREARALPRRIAADRCGEEGAEPLQRPAAGARPRPRADRGGGPEGAHRSGPHEALHPRAADDDPHRAGQRRSTRRFQGPGRGGDDGASLRREPRRGLDDRLEPVLAARLSAAESGGSVTPATPRRSLRIRPCSA